MKTAPINLVAGPSGSGKTSWIYTHFHSQQSPQALGAYLALGAQIPVDASYLATESPTLEVLDEAQRESIAAVVEMRLAEGAAIYVEIGFHIDPLALVLPFDPGLCHRVAVLPSSSEDLDLKNWADDVVPAAEVYRDFSATQIWRSPLTGQILDPASLDTFWHELTQGAYGAVHRAKGIFDLVDGRAFYFNYVAGLPNTQYVELKVPRWLKGRPERFSGLEVVGEGFDQASIASTLGDCGLEDDAIAYYQAQIKESLGEQAA
ncbi:MAG: GTP-binding protein [Thermosynechococcaceae cyanobacterium MS004]|nr:GTP-binding protein [Thermosynechococcaceae cyanobacterium MS004]